MNTRETSGRSRDEVQYYDWRLTRWSTSETRDRLDATGRGIYRELLDHCYAQGSFPDDSEWICRKCACDMRHFKKWWPVIERHFPKSRREGHRRNIVADIWRKMYFSRCEENRRSRKIGIAKARKSKEIGSSRATQSTLETQPASNERSALSTPETQRASNVRSTNVRPKEVKEVIEVIEETQHMDPAPVRAVAMSASQRFPEWWQRYPLKDNQDSACRAYLSVVTVDEERAAFACLDRYAASDSVSRNVVMSAVKFLFTQKKNAWRGEWPQPAQVAQHRKLSNRERLVEEMRGNNH